MRAILLASATAASLKGFFSISFFAHIRNGSVWRPVTMSLFDQGISGAMMTSIAVSPSMAKMTATASVESD